MDLPRLTHHYRVPLLRATIPSETKASYQDLVPREIKAGVEHSRPCDSAHSSPPMAAAIGNARVGRANGVVFISDWLKKNVRATWDAPAIVGASAGRDGVGGASTTN
jgi:hypothetical protein